MWEGLCFWTHLWHRMGHTHTHTSWSFLPSTKSSFKIMLSKVSTELQLSFHSSIETPETTDAKTHGQYHLTLPFSTGCQNFNLNITGLFLWVFLEGYSPQACTIQKIQITLSSVVMSVLPHLLCEKSAPSLSSSHHNVSLFIVCGKCVAIWAILQDKGEVRYGEMMGSTVVWF